MKKLLNTLTIKEAHKGLVSKKFSSVDLTKACLDQIKSLDKKINAFITVTEDLALEQAKKVDKKIKSGGKLKPLEGIPMALKDNILVKDAKCTAGSKILENYIASYDATVVKKLKEAGAVILGKTNLDEFAMGSSTESSYFGSTKNPIDTKKVPGGSSGGSVAAVASDMCFYALGSETGGSVRQPASLCGVIGMKPSYGRVSRYGLMAMASSLDQISPTTKTVEDLRMVLDCIMGVDKKDSTTVDLKEEKPKKKSIKGMKIGVPKEYFIKGMDKEVEKRVREGIKKLEKLGAKMVDISLPHTEYALAVYYIVMPSEVSSNLSRYDGIRYGFTTVSKAKNLMDVYFETRRQGFGDEARRRIMLGTYALSSGYYDAYYKKAQQVRTLIKNDFDKAFTKVDCIVTPTSPTVAWDIGEKFDDPLTMYLSDIYTVSANIAGIPGISVPCGEAHNLPVGLQLLGKQFDEETILNVASEYEEYK
ncbi:MAG: Asp-tRNA(Asn)/Glu-tRNA(Gln) amidotransferase subunit GatA [Patescibacteria group bacterium]|nr:Asp-tRNA(Asn)/Glu-tRNA(Gln) amidotransferase subunit GatA [Patescibacteria group bacterium]